jgi:hypothetical protein
MRLRFACSIALCVGVLVPHAAHARDWFVRGGAQSGDGTKAQPFADPWQALDKCEANDAIHVTAGKYYGRLGLGTWKIPFDGVQLIGGYDRDFTARDPWKNHTELLWDAKSKNWPKEERVSSTANGTVVDGVIIDMQDQNEYVDAERTGRRDKSAESAMHFVLPVTVRNSVIINPGENGIDCTGASVIENNLIINAVGWGVWVKSGQKETATVRNNTIVFTWTFKVPGLGAYQGSAVGVQGPTNVTGNILAFNDNQGVYQTVPPEKVSITNNDFFMNLYANLKFGVNGVEQGIGDKQMDMLEEVGLKAYSGNIVKNPLLPFDKAWMDTYSKRTAGQAGKLEMNDWNNVRQALGLTLIGKSYKQAGGIAPPWQLEKALALMQPKAAITAGARMQRLEVRAFSTVAAAPAKNYEPSELTAWNKQPESVDGKALEMVVAVGPAANTNGIPSQYAQDQHAAAFLYDKDGKGERVTGFFKKGSSAQRSIDEASGYYQGTGKPDRLYVVRGLAHVVNNVPKAGFFVESVEPFSGGAQAAAAPRPAGRNWFVRAGSAGGDGTKEKPFKDPYQALEKSQAGDTIHVTEGEYYGKLHAGNWNIDTTNIALLGGYDKDFTTRNPWKHPTLLRTGDDYKGHRTGYTIEGGQSDHTGAIIDGFVFDKRSDNKYTQSGDLDYSNSDKNPHLWLARPGCIVRNNLFINGAEGAIRGANAQTYENNIFFNHYTKTLDIQPGFGDAPVVIRNNTFAFAWDMKFGQGRGRLGTLLIVGTRVRAVIDNNIFEFADNDAIRLQADAKDVELTRNTFSHNLWSAVQKPDGWVVVDDKSWGQLADFGWKKLSGNQIVSAALPLDQKWFDIYLHRTAMVPGKVTMDDWNSLREVLGQPVIAKGGKEGTGMAPAYDWKKALALFPKNARVTAGARAADQPVKFSGSAPRAEEAREYQEVTWDTAKNGDTWDKLEGKRVSLKVVIIDSDNQYKLDDIKKEDYLCFTNYGPEGIDSGGLPLRAYVKRGTKAERVVQQAKSYSRGQPEQTYVLKGVARSGRQVVAEVVERAD